MLDVDISDETLRFIIDKAHEFHAKEAVTIPETPLSPSDDWVLQVLADHSDDPTVLELRNVVEDLGADQRVALVALMWCGRGDYDAVTEWDTAMADALAAANDRTLEYLLATPLLADYLEEALSQIQNAE